MNKVLIFLLIVDVAFLATGGVLVGLAVKTRADFARGPTLSNVAENLLLTNAPLTGVIANGVLVFVAFFLSVPALVLQRSRNWLRGFAGVVILNALFTLVIGLVIWFSTLRTRSNLRSLWAKQSPDMQSLLQRRWDCCGYVDAATPPFQRDATCTNALVAAQKPGCMGPFADFGNSYLDRIFTAFFGMVALDVVVLLSAAVLLKERIEKERFHYSDLKNGLRGI